MIDRRLMRGLQFFFALLCFFAEVSRAGSVGVYGVGQDHPQLSRYAVDTVFVPPKPELIAAQVAAGREVFLTLNVFGGSEAWKDFPDSVPVASDGQHISAEYAGICPSHVAWRENRLKQLAGWVKDFGGKNGISGVWLDFIRYPGRWEHTAPHVSDTCYCARCLGLFQAEKGIQIPDERTSIRTKADWIRSHVLLQWMDWKKERIASFVRDARKVLDENAPGRKLRLGVFLVPWRKSDLDGALSFQLAQDAEQFVPYVDVFSPMVYHRMTGNPVSWIGEITDYYAGMTHSEVWPIIQVEGVDAKEFGQVIKNVSNSEAAKMLVYTFKDLAIEHWSLLEQFKPSQNLLQNPLLKLAGGSVAGENSQQVPWSLPEQWFTPPGGRVQDSTFWIIPQENGNAVGLTAGYDRQAVWTTALPACKPGDSYLFSGEFLRRNRQDSLAYPEISLWGQDYTLNTHRMAAEFQKLKSTVTCPASYHEEDVVFEFRNNHPGNSFWMRSPKLVALESTRDILSPPPVMSFFPIGVYGANSDNIREIKNIGLNTAVVGMDQETIEACLALGMRCTFSVPREPEKLIHALDTFDPLLRQGQFSYYVNDEPGIHSFPEWKAEDIQRIIKSRFPKAATTMAIVRPQVVPFYQKSADYFMLDQYPVPNMPLTWLSDSMDEAAMHVGRGRLQSVIQAFGDKKYSLSGWPRRPTFQEMNCLTFLSVIHGSRGIYFFTFPEITTTKQGKEDFVRLISRLNSMRSWLQVHNDDKLVSLHMTSTYQFDPRGNPAIHCATKEQYKTQMLICVNTLQTATEAEIYIPSERQLSWQDYYTGEPAMVNDGTILVRFVPLETKVLIESK